MTGVTFLVSIPARAICRANARGVVVRHHVCVHAHVMPVGHAVVVTAPVAARKERVAHRSFGGAEILVRDDPPFGIVEMDAPINSDLATFFWLGRSARLLEYRVAGLNTFTRTVQPRVP